MTNPRATHPFAVIDGQLVRDGKGDNSVLGRFDTADEASVFIETLPEYETGRYGIDGPEDPDVPEDIVRAAILTLFPDAELAADDDGQLVINTNVMWSGKNGDHLLGNMNVGVDEGICFRCELPIESRVEVIWLDSKLRNDCGESEDGAPHEPARVMAHITPEAWINDNAIEVDAPGEQEWDATRSFMRLNPSYREELRQRMVDDRFALDRHDALRDDPSAPEWVHRWSGPFNITVRLEWPEEIA